MFDLKAKLLAKGLVTEQQVEKITREKKREHLKATPKENSGYLSKERAKILDNLKALPKSEQYVAIRKWVDINRLDKLVVSVDCEKFFITTKDNQVTWLTLPTSILEAIQKGEAGVIAYMSNHGLTHAVVPRDIAEDIGQIFPEWLKVLNDKNYRQFLEVQLTRCEYFLTTLWHRLKKYPTSRQLRPLFWVMQQQHWPPFFSSILD